jgi:hypothetical protein
MAVQVAGGFILITGIADLSRPTCPSTTLGPP